MPSKRAAPPPSKPSNDKLAYRVDEAAYRISVSPSTIWREMKEGKIPALKQGGSTLILHSDLMKYLESLSPWQTRSGNRPVEVIGTKLKDK
jgi:excisionase family DNA binding protein